MKNSKQLEMALAYCHKSKAALARDIGTTHSNLHQKMKRDSLTRDELERIAEVLGAKFVVYFEFPDGTKI